MFDPLPAPPLPRAEDVNACGDFLTPSPEADVLALVQRLAAELLERGFEPFAITAPKSYCERLLEQVFGRSDNTEWIAGGRSERAVYVVHNLEVYVEEDAGALVVWPTTHEVSPFFPNSKRLSLGLQARTIEGRAVVSSRLWICPWCPMKGGDARGVLYARPGQCTVGHELHEASFETVEDARRRGWLVDAPKLGGDAGDDETRGRFVAGRAAHHRVVDLVDAIHAWRSTFACQFTDPGEYARASSKMAGALDACHSSGALDAFAVKSAQDDPRIGWDEHRLALRRLGVFRDVVDTVSVILGDQPWARDKETRDPAFIERRGEALAITLSQKLAERRIRTAIKEARPLPDGPLVVTIPEGCPPSGFDHFRDGIRAAFPDRRVVIVQAGTEVSSFDAKIPMVAALVRVVDLAAEVVVGFSGSDHVDPKKVALLRAVSDAQAIVGAPVYWGVPFVEATTAVEPENSAAPVVESPRVETWPVYRLPDTDTHRELCAFEDANGGEDVIGHVATCDGISMASLTERGAQVVGRTPKDGRVRLVQAVDTTTCKHGRVYKLEIDTVNGLRRPVLRDGNWAGPGTSGATAPARIPGRRPPHTYSPNIEQHVLPRAGEEGPGWVRRRDESTMVTCPLCIEGKMQRDLGPAGLSEPFDCIGCDGAGKVPKDEVPMVMPGHVPGVVY